MQGDSLELRLITEQLRKANANLVAIAQLINRMHTDLKRDEHGAVVVNTQAVTRDEQDENG